MKKPLCLQKNANHPLRLAIKRKVRTCEDLRIMHALASMHGWHIQVYRSAEGTVGGMAGSNLPARRTETTRYLRLYRLRNMLFSHYSHAPCRLLESLVAILIRRSDLPRFGSPPVPRSSSLAPYAQCLMCCPFLTSKNDADRQGRKLSRKNPKACQRACLDGLASYEYPDSSLLGGRGLV